jgi:manganese efflux pump family protein
VYRAKGASLVPPDRHFPLAVVITHGVLAFTTVTLVLLTTLGVGGA